MLVRDFIHDSLYHPVEGYFTSRPVSVGETPQPLEFVSMLGQRHYTSTLDSLYKERESSWFTPVELFRPWYGRALGRYILSQHKLEQTKGSTAPLVVYEVGGGSGTCALDILDFFAAKAPDVYASMQYVTVEISEALAAKQESRVGQVESHRERYAVWGGHDAAVAEAWGAVDDSPCYVVMLEVLDNLPHDRICRGKDGRWMQTRVRRNDRTATGLEEVLEPLTDPLIQRCLAAVHPTEAPSGTEVYAAAAAGPVGPIESDTWQHPVETAGKVVQSMVDRWLLGGRATSVEFLPTNAMALFEVLHRARPNHRIVAADFDHLPDVAVAGRNAPLVASKRAGSTHDHSTYLVPRGEADIFFPTDFAALQRIYAASSCSPIGAEGGGGDSATPPATSQVMSTQAFMERYAEVSATRTRDGYNPLLDDFTNTRFLLS